MLKKLIKVANKHAGATVGIMFVLLFLAVEALSWIITCGIIKLITLCFGWTFSWGTATGIWLIICLAKGIFSHSVTVKK